MLRSYNEDKLLENYNLFIDVLKKSFSGERLERLLHMYSFDELGVELMMSPASSRVGYHCAYPGGYIDHILNVVKMSLKVSNMFAENVREFGIPHDPDYTREELLFAAFHHDLGKLGEKNNPKYIPEDRKWHRENRGSVYVITDELPYMDMHHHTLYLLSQYGIKYTKKEMFGIILADGMYSDYAKTYLMSIAEERALRTDLPYIIHWADHMATRIEHYEFVKNQNIY